MKKHEKEKRGRSNSEEFIEGRADANIISIEITEELEKSYIDYAMSVIVSRALPDVRDGLKPVHRRILWAMWNLGLTHNAKYRKSSNVVGEVLGKYHPHGDSSVYDAIVRMAQDFSLRYPLIDGQGNWGSIDGDNAAAMRYTEARLSKIASELLFDIEKDTVNFIPNYDSSRTEPVTLPSKLPHFLLNGSVGIAVGMATDIPPHNLTEIIDAIICLIHKPDSSTKDLMKFVKGPDFPTGGMIYDRRAIIEAYSSGQGAIRARGKVDVVETKKERFNIVISEIPYRVNKAELIKKIATLVVEKKIQGIKNIRDESDKEGLSIVIELKTDVTPKKIINQLYKHTELQKDFHLNMIGLVNGIQPQVLSLKDILKHYLEYRQEVVRRRTEYDLNKAKERAHILEGLKKALDNIDEVIKTIKKSKDKNIAHKNLRKEFKFSDAQATAILEMKLQTLASLERHKIEDELKEKNRLIKELENILSSKKEILNVIEKELIYLKETYGDKRRTKVIEQGLGEFKEEDLIPQEKVIIALSRNGYIKRLDPKTFKAQKRGGKGMSGSNVKEDDFLKSLIYANTHDNILFFTSSGKVFQTKVYEIPQGSRVSRGKLIQNFLDVPSSESIEAIVAYSEKNNKYKYLIMSTEKGIIKRTPIEDFSNVRRNGIIAINLKKDDKLVRVGPSYGDDDILMVTLKAQSIRFKENDIRPMGRVTSGVRGIKLKKGDKVIGIDIISEDEKRGDNFVLVITKNGYAKRTELLEYKVQKRGGSGIKTAKLTSKTKEVATYKIIKNEEDLFILSSKGQVIRTQIGNIRISSRDTSGVRVMRVNEGDEVVAIACI